MNIVLIGYRGSGKTTLGRKLADKMWLKFVDTDVLISERAGKTIAEIFATQGEPAFRDLESAIIAEVAAGDGQLIALGGGAILRTQNLAALKQNGARIVYLHASTEILAQRIAGDPNTAATRPPLTSPAGPKSTAQPPAKPGTKNPDKKSPGGTPGTGSASLEEIRTVMAIREPLYRAAADATLDVTYLNPDDAIYHLTRLL